MSDAEVRKLIEAKNRAVEGWYAAGEVEKLGQAFSAETWQMPPNASPLVGRDALVAFWSQAVKWGDWSFDLDTQDVRVSGRLAVERGRYRLRYAAGPAAPPDMPSFQDHGNYVVVWRQEEDGEWRILWDAPVSEQPLPH